MITPRKGENKCWRFSENSLPYRVVLGWDGSSDYGWSLGSGRVRWVTVYATEREALDFTRSRRAAKVKELTDVIAAIDKRLVRLAAVGHQEGEKDGA